MKASDSFQLQTIKIRGVLPVEWQSSSRWWDWIYELDTRSRAFSNFVPKPTNIIFRSDLPQS